MTTPADRERGTLLALLGIVLVALSMRSAAGVIGAVFPILADDLEMDVVVLSVLGAAPPFGFALAGLLVPATTRRIGLEGALIAAIAFIGIGQLVRAASQEPILLVASTFLVMVGIGAGNVLLPPIVRRYAPRRIGLVTGVYLVL
ncbi:MAG: MFS transporter, partial [Pseudolysinimonas sp.]